jgi:hypothetical protein
MPANQLDELRAVAARGSASASAEPLEGDFGAELEPLNAFCSRIIEQKAALEAAQDKHMEAGTEATKAAVAKQSHAVNALVRDALNSCSEYDLRTRKRFADTKLSRTEAEARLRQCAMIRRRVVELSKETWKSQHDHRADVTDQVARRVNERFESAGQPRRAPEEAQKIAQTLIRTNRERMLFRLAVLELEDAVKEREAIDEIEQSVAELLQIMEEYRAALADQSELVLHVEENVQRAEKYTTKGVKQLHEAANSSCCCCSVQ